MRHSEIAVRVLLWSSDVTHRCGHPTLTLMKIIEEAVGLPSSVLMNGMQDCKTWKNLIVSPIGVG
uniref:Uncharacterized protein n=1 Tax=Octopus bimaculoides TaxID=37653 RepID=A0A0L8GCX2_OCTBM